MPPLVLGGAVTVVTGGSGGGGGGVTLDAYDTLDATHFGSLQNPNTIPLDTSGYISNLWQWQPTAGANVTARGLGGIAHFEALLSDIVGSDFNPSTDAIEAILEITNWPSVDGTRWGPCIAVCDTSDNGLGVSTYDALSTVSIFAIDDASAPSLANLLSTSQNLLNVPSFAKMKVWWVGTTMYGLVEWDGSLNQTIVTSGVLESEDPVSTTLANLRFRIGLCHPNSGQAPTNHLWQTRVYTRKFPKSEIYWTP